MIRILYVLAIAICLSGCDSEEGTPTYKLELVSGNNILGLQSTLLAQDVVLSVTDEAGNPLADVEVSAAVIEGGGSIEGFDRMSGADGLVRVQWKLGEALGQQMAVRIEEDISQRVTVNAVTQYKYKLPAEDNDGWEVGDLGFLSTAGQELVSRGIDELRKGNYPEVHSVLIMKDRKLVLEEYYPGTTSNGTYVEWDRFTKHEIQSASKSFRSMLTGIAIEKGFIESVDVPFFSFFPEYADLNDEPLKDDITLDHVLTMSAGFQWDEWTFPYTDSRNNLGVMYGLGNQALWAPYVLGLPMQYEPGSTFAYSTGTSLMLSSVIANSIDTDMNSFLREYYIDLVEGPGNNTPNGATMTPREMAKLGYIYLYDGKWKDNQIISKDWIERSITPRFQNINSSGSYGYQWWLKTFNTNSNSYDAYYASGNGGQNVIVFRDLDMVVVFTGGNFGSTQMFDILNWMEKRVLQAFEE